MIYLFEDFALDARRRELRRGDAIVSVEPQVFDLLAYLMQNSERVVSKDDLRAAIWRGRIVSESSLAFCINSARRAVGDDGNDQRLIRTLPRKGFRFVGPLRQEQPPIRPAVGEGSQSVDRNEVVPSPGTRPGAAEKPALAVLPFEAVGGGLELASFCHELTDSIITGLSRISAIRVIARNSMFTYQTLAVDIRDIGRELGARYILEGSVRGPETRIRVSAQLIEAASHHHIWVEQLDRARAEIFDRQNEITRSIVASVQTQLILNEGKLAAKRDAATESASHLLARSWQRFLMLTAESLADSKALAERALEMDSRSAMAHRMVAVCLYHQAYMGFIPWTEQVVDELHSRAKTAIECEDADEYCHWAMECAHLLRKEHERAVASLQRALEINPNCSLAYGSMGTVRAWMGQYDASVASNEFALRINPQDPTNFFRHFGLALAHYLARRYDKALPHAGRVLQTRPSWWLAQIIYTASLAQLGQRDEACKMMAELRRTRPAISASSLGTLPFAQVHDRDHLLEGLRHAGLPE